MKGKKGLSTVVTTLIIVLLVLAAIGIIWNPIKNLLTQSSESFDQTKCLEMDVNVKKVTNGSAMPSEIYNVTLQRSPTGPEEEMGVKIIFFSDTESSGAEDFGEMLSPLEISTQSIQAGIQNATKLQLTMYFIEESTGAEKLCQASKEFSFTI